MPVSVLRSGHFLKGNRLVVDIFINDCIQATNLPSSHFLVALACLQAERLIFYGMCLSACVFECLCVCVLTCGQQLQKIYNRWHFCP